MKILVIQQKMIGDVLVSSILCENLRKEYKNAQIDFMVYESTIAVLEGNRSIDNLIIFKEKHRKSKWELLKFLFQIRKEKYDVVIDAYSKLESWLVVAFSGAKQKISYFKKIINLLYTDTIPRTRTSNTNFGLIIDQRLDLLQPLNLKIDLDPFPKIVVTQNEIDFADELFNSYGINRTKKTIMISIIGSELKKTYPLQYMSKLIDFIANESEVNLLFNYIPKQIEDATKIYDGCLKTTQEKIYFNILGKNIRSFIAIMNNCDMIIGNDGGAINMAKALYKPSYIIFSPWIDKKGWATFEDGINNVSVHLADFRPELIENQNYKSLIRNAFGLYHEFKPTLIEPSLKKFLSIHLN